MPLPQLGQRGLRASRRIRRRGRRLAPERRALLGGRAARVRERLLQLRLPRGCGRGGRRGLARQCLALRCPRVPRGRVLLRARGAASSCDTCLAWPAPRCRLRLLQPGVMLQPFAGSSLLLCLLMAVLQRPKRADRESATLHFRART